MGVVLEKTAAEAPTKIGRFRVAGVLGRGAQSIVYLARDTQLDREVAIKALPPAKGGADALLAEAHTVARLRHPNIVPLFEAGEEGGRPYLVFEYVEGETLAEVIKRDAPLSPTRACRIACLLADGLAHAHEAGVVHRDLKPRNILMSAEGYPRLTDFGIAASLSGDTGRDASFAGTVAYMAPEYLTDREFSARSDLFSLGLVIAELLTGQRVFQGGDNFQVMNQVAHGEIRLEAAPGNPIPQPLVAILLRLLERKPASRYASARELKAALDAFLAAEQGGGEAGGGGTVEFLLRRMRHKKDFPALSETISQVNRILGSETEGVSELSGAILKDFSLTNKILRLVNTASFKHAGGNVSTISRAVTILGFDQVRHVILSLLLFDHIKDKGKASQLKEECVRTILAGVIARDTGRRLGLRDPEEAFVCAMFHHLGRILALYYFPEETEEVRRIMDEEGCGEHAAAVRALGVSFEELGMGTAKQWGFPAQITLSMQALPEGPQKKPSNASEAMRLLAGFSNEVAETVASRPEEDWKKALADTAARFKGALPVDQEKLGQQLQTAVGDLKAYGDAIAFNVHHSQVARKLKSWTGRGDEAGDEDPEATDTALKTVVLEQAPGAEPDTIEPGGTPASDTVPAAHVLASGIQDITQSLVEGASLNEVLRIVLETMYRAMRYQRVLLCVREPRGQTMVGRFGYGADTNRIAHSFSFPMSFTPDVFHAAMSKNVDILIADVDDPKIASRVPDWYRKLVSARTFLLFPLVVKDKPFGLIYADGAKPGSINVADSDLKLLKTLRNQALLAIRQAA